MFPGDQKPFTQMQKVVDFFERESIQYRIVGSMASIVYGETRMTNDVDILVDLPLEQAEALSREFPPPEYYVSLEAMQQAIKSRHQFNIIYVDTGFKVDIMIPSNTEFSQLDITLGQRHAKEGVFNAMFATPENVILKKLQFFKEGGSDKHLRDIAGILNTQGDKIDQDYLDKWAAELGVVEELEVVRRKLSEN